MERQINIIIIDDEEIKVNQISQKFELGEKICKNENIFTINPINIALKSNIDEFVSEIIEKNCECAIIDYKLNSKSCVEYNGIELANELKKRISEFPIFILTSLEDDLYNNETYDTYSVFDYVRIQDEEKEFKELKKKIVEQVLITERKIDLWKKELNNLLPDKNKNVEIDQKILDLDSKLEKALGGNNSIIPEKAKKELLSNKADEMIQKLFSAIDDILKG